MSDGVPAWLAVAGVVGGLTVGSLDVVDKAINWFKREPVHLSEHYFILELSPGIDQGVQAAALEDLKQIGPSAVVFPERIEHFLTEAVGSEAASLICEEGIQPSFAYGCVGLNPRVVFYSLRNDSDLPINEVAIDFRLYDISNPSYAALLTAPTERQIVRAGERACLKDAFASDTAEDCWAISGTIETVSLPQPLLPGEFLHVPIHASIFAWLSDENYASWGAETGYLPELVAVGNESSFEARDLSDTLVIRYERLFAGG